MVEYFASGRAVDLILLLMGLESLALVTLWVRRGRGIPPLALAVNLATGACLLLAVRTALTGAPWVWPACFLTAALLVHLVDLRLRWQSAPAPLQRAGTAVDRPEEPFGQPHAGSRMRPR